MATVFIARQPIYSLDNTLYAYELLYRNSKQNRSKMTDETDATIQLLLNALIHIGLDNIVGKTRAFINVPEAFLTKSHPIPFSPDQVTIDIGDHIPCNTKTIKGMRRLIKKGYEIAVNFAPTQNDRKGFYELATILRLNQKGSKALQQDYQLLKQYPAKRLIDRIETREQYNDCIKLFPDYCQGFYFRKPQIIEAQKIPSNRMAILNLVSQLQEPEIEISEIERLIQTDVTLSLKLLKTINSARYGLPREVESISEAVVYVGLAFIRQWATLILLANLDDKPQELILASLIRSKMCEYIANELKRENSATYALIGLFSMIDALMDSYMGEVLAHLPFSKDVIGALSHNKGPYADVLNCVVSYDSGEWDKKKSISLPTEVLQDSYVQAVKWASEVADDIM